MIGVEELPSERCALDIESLCADYDRRAVIHDISLKVPAGQTFGVVGLNGVGKTTMIKCILALKEPSAGSIRVFGASNDSSESRGQVAYLPERFDPPWFLTGGEFVRFSSSLYGREVGEDEIRATCEALALDPEVLGRRVQTYSKGMRQKLGLIATIVTGCRMLILDEPMSGLDPLARALVKKLLRQVKAQGRTIVLSSHILSDMDEICDQIAVVDDGKIHFIGAPRVLRDQSGEETLERAFLKTIHKAA